MSVVNNYVIPEDMEDLEPVIRFCFDKMMLYKDFSAPAIVKSYDRSSKRVNLEIAIAYLKSDYTTFQRAPLNNIPVYRMGGGGFFFDFNLQEGDLGWIKSNDNDISLFLQSNNLSAPNTLRTNNFSDGVFYPDIVKNIIIAPEDTDNLVIQNEDGTVKISMGQDAITLTAPNIYINSNLQVSGELTVQQGIVSSGGSPAIRANGDITASGSITADVP